MPFTINAPDDVVDILREMFNTISRDTDGTLSVIDTRWTYTADRETWTFSIPKAPE